ncbi:MAG TPA: type II toxin-antitoxin system RelE/ParE family toxin [Steroidobacteraceae bacterium]|nr:type II toxin-antitoxin system RelE/ParE family toxin [Steroidobacteraceae bacterium]
MSRITKTARAEQDLEEIWFYVAVDNVGAADALLDELENSVRLLATQPKMGRAREELASELRSFPVRRYVVFYRPLVDGIEVVRVLHGARDVTEIAEEGGFG